MSGEFQRMPLFLLDTVLFPYAALQLHVFEERYLKMVRDCLRDDLPFGVVLIRSGSEVGDFADPYLVGTSVRFLDVHQLENGRLELHVMGERRFRIRKFDESEPYLVGLVEPVEDGEVDDSPRDLALTLRAQELFKEYVATLFQGQEADVQVVLPQEPETLGFAIANLLQMDNLDKQRLLESTDPLGRLVELIPILERECESIQDLRKFTRLHPNDLREWISPN